MATKIQLRGDTYSAWRSKNPVLAEREVALVSTKNNKRYNTLKIGDGVSHFNDLPFLFEGADYVGIADTTTNPPAYDGNVFYIATEPGIYSNFGGIEVESYGVYILENTGGTWSLKEVMPVDSELSAESLRPLQNKAVSESIARINEKFSLSESIVDDESSTKVVDYFERMSSNRPGYLTSVFSGFGFGIGEVSGSFRYLWTKVHTIDQPDKPATLISKVLVQIRQTDKNGSLLFSRSFNIVPIQSTNTKDIYLDLGEDLTFTGELYLIIRFNSFASLVNANVTDNPTTTPGEFFTYGNMEEDAIGTTVAGNGTLNRMFFKLYSKLVMKSPNADLESQITDLKNEKQSKTDESLQTSDKTVTGAINELQKALGLENVTRINIEVGEANAYIDSFGKKTTDSKYDLSTPIALKVGQVLYGKTYSSLYITVISKSTDVANIYNIIKSGFEVGNGIKPLCYIPTKDIEVILTKSKTNEPELYIADIGLASGLLRKGGQDVGFEDFKNNKFVRRSDSNGEDTDAYEEGLLDCFIDTELYPNAAINEIRMWCYGTILFISDFNGSSNTVIFRKSFADISDYEPVDIIVSEKKIGYVVFSDKQKFLDNIAGNGPSLNKFWANRPHEYIWIYRTFLKKSSNLDEELSNLNKDIVKKPVKLQDTNFCVNETIGNNLCNPDTLTKGQFYINDLTGTVGDDSIAGYGYTDYIPIGKDGITITNGNVAGKVIGHAVYNADKEFIRGYRTNTIDYQEGDAYVRFSIGRDTEHVMVAKGQTALPYEPYEGAKEVISENVLPNTVVNPIKTYDPIEISLPDKIYAVVGDTLQLFYRGMIQAVDPYRYNILISCSKGKQCPRYFEYTPAAGDVGSVDFTITVKDDDRNVLSTKTCQLVTIDVVKSPTSNLKVMCFGDSLTSAGKWCREADRRLTEAGGTPTGKELTNIDFVGSQKNGSTGYFGVGGWNWSSYTQQGRPAYRFQVSGVTSLTVGAIYTNNGNTFTIMEVNVTESTGNILCSVSNLAPAPEDSGVLTKSSGNGDATITYSSVAEDTQNPLWDNEENKMSFIPYANEVSEGRIDVVYTLLTWNSHTAAETDFSSMLTEMKVFADTLHKEFPNAKLKIMGVQVPSVRGGMGANYGADGSGYADGYGMVVTALNMNKFYQEFANDEAYSSFVEFVNVSSQFDTDYMMPHNEKVVNTRSTVKEWMDTNGLHPSNEGYLQIGDVVYRNFIANFCQ